MKELINEIESLKKDNFQAVRNLMGNYNISYAELGRELHTSRQSAFDTLHSENMYLSTFLEICKKLEAIIELRTSNV